MHKVRFHYADQKLNLFEKKRLRLFIQEIFKKEKIRIEKINYVFCSDAFLLKINQDFLKHDFYTDTITFSLAAADQPVLGEIYISLERVKENAVKFGVPFKEEAKRVIFHSALHLCGYGDKKKSEKLLIRRKEDDYLRLYTKGST